MDVRLNLALSQPRPLSTPKRQQTPVFGELTPSPTDPMDDKRPPYNPWAPYLTLGGMVAWFVDGALAYRPFSMLAAGLCFLGLGIPILTHAARKHLGRKRQRPPAIDA